MKFSIGTVLSITTGVLLTDIGNVYKILNYMTGESLYTHQLPRVSRECAPVILRQHPELSNVNSNGIDKTNWQEFLKEQTDIYGEEIEIEPVGIFEHKKIDPLQELADIVGEDKIIVLQQ